MSDAMPLISVIMPTYNCAAVIHESIESVLHQTHQQLELIVVDDGSTDHTETVVRALAERDPRLHYVKIPNSKSPTARNTGFALAKGEYIAVVDSDDLWPEQKLEWQLHALNQTGASVALGHVHRFTTDENGETEWGRISKVPMLPTDYLSQILMITNTQMVNFNTMLARASVIKTIGNWDPLMVTAHDWDVWLRLAGLVKFVHIDRELQFYRKHTASVTSHHNVLTALSYQLRAIDRHAPKGVAGWYLKKESKRLRYQTAISALLDKSLPQDALKLFIRSSTESSMLWRSSGWRWMVRILREIF
jgi:glycosyltransferase involved in cell wall biosynthesis